MRTIGLVSAFMAFLLTISFIPLMAANLIRGVLNPEDHKHMVVISKAMNSNADPCHDFHQYACGNGVELEKNLGLMSEVKYRVNLLQILASYYPITNKVNQTYGEKLHLYFKGCENARNASLLPFLKEVKPLDSLEWPLLQDIQAYREGRRESNPQLTENFNINVLQLLGKLFSYGLNDIFFTYEKVYLEDKLFMQLKVPTPKKVATTELMEILMATRLPQSVMEKYIKEFMEVHLALQAMYERFASDTSYVMGNYPALNSSKGVLSQLAQFLQLVMPHPAKVEELSFVFRLNYVRELFSIQWEQKGTRKFCNYFMFQFLLHLRETVGASYFLISPQTKLSLGVNFVYYKHLILPHKEEHDKSFNATVQTVYKYFVARVAENRLQLTDQQLQEMGVKLSKLRLNIGNLPFNVTEAMVEEYYKALPDFDSDNFYRTELAVRKHAHLEMFICPENMFCLESPPHGFYNPHVNMITFPFPALTPPMFHATWHPVFAMSMLGFAAGHELVHAIDPTTLNMRHYTPSMGGNSLLVPSIREAVECLMEQNPTDAIIERLADVVGAQLVFDLYQSEYGMQPNFTQTSWQKLYFISLGQTFCGTRLGEDQVHDGFKLRINEIVMNSKEFAQAFQCPVGSKMNPKKKCSYI